MSAVTDLVVSLQRALKATQLYGLDHPRHTEAVLELEACYQKLLQGREQLRITAVSGRLYADGCLEDPDNLHIRTMAHDLEERGVAVLLLLPGPSTLELQDMLLVLAQNPSRLRAQGGVQRLLEAKKVRRIQTASAHPGDEPRSGEPELVFMDAGRVDVAAPIPPAEDRRTPPGGPVAVVEDRRTPQVGPIAFTEDRRTPQAGPIALMEDRRTPQAGPVVFMVEHLVSRTGGQVPPDLSELGSALESLGLDPQVSTPTTLGVMRDALDALDPERQVDLFRGAASLAPGPLRDAFSRFAERLAAQALAATLARGTLSFQHIVDIAEELKPLLPDADGWMVLLVEALRKAGAPGVEVDSLARRVAWGRQPLEARLASLAYPQRILEIPARMVLGFLKEILDAGHVQPFLRLLHHHAGALSGPSRAAVAEDFVALAGWASALPEVAADRLGEILVQAWCRERDPGIHERISLAVEQLLNHWLDQGDGVRANGLVSGLRDEDTVSLWKAQSAAGILGRAGTAERVDRVLERLHRTDAQLLAAQVFPLLERMGSMAVERTVARLAGEPSPMRRKPLAEALQHCIRVDGTALLEALASREVPTLRRALILAPELLEPGHLPELGPFLEHRDPVVAAAAIVALGRTEGAGAAPVLVRLLSARDLRIRMGALGMLGELESPLAVPALTTLLKPGKWRPDEVPFREKAALLLGRLGAGEAIPMLAALLVRHRGLFAEHREALPVRIASLRALFAMDNLEAQDAIGHALDAEPGGPEREALQSALTEAIAGA